MAAFQQSNEQATRNGIMALEQAHTGVFRSRQDVESMRNNLSTNFQGTDGNAFKELIRQWEGRADTILRNLEDMIDRLNGTLTEHQKAQGSSNEAINNAYQQSNAAFDQLMGTA